MHRRRLWHIGVITTATLLFAATTMAKLRRAGSIATLALVVMVGGACGSGGPENTAGSTNATTSAGPQIDFLNPSATSGCPSPECSAILAQVAAGATTDTVPPDLTPRLRDAAKDLRLPDGSTCSQLPISGLKDNWQPCTFHAGAPGTPMMILIGDSRAWMWSVPMDEIAKQLGYGFGLVYRPGCRMSMVKFGNTDTGATDAQCKEWMNAAIDWVNQQNPAAVLVASGHQKSENKVSDADDAAGYAAVVKKLQGPARKVFVTGDLPVPKQDPPRCLSAHTTSALKCATPTSVALPANQQQAAYNAAQQTGAAYVNLSPFVCTPDICPAIIGNYAVYQDSYHLTTTYAETLVPVVKQALNLSPV
jgi:hypothetical protein